MAEQIVVSDYDPSWPSSFELLHDRIWPIVEGTAVRIDHVGSTAVPGLAAKPIIDMDIVVASADDVAPTIALLGAAGYRWDGDLGVAEREAFSAPTGLERPVHHLYLVVAGSRPHADHVLLRDLLRDDDEACRRYEEVKRRSATDAGSDLERYVAAKASLVAALLARARAERGLAPVSYWEPELDEPPTSAAR